MSQLLISRNPDLKRLRDEGFDVSISKSKNFLVVKRVPYVNSKKEIQYGMLASELTVAGDVTTAPNTHVIHFAGEYPCDQHGVEITKIRNQNEQKTLDEHLVIQHSFSSKPSGGYKDHYEKLTTYVAILTSPAQAINPGVNATPYPTIEAQDDDSVFNYIDTASSRAGINVVTRKLEIGRVAIIGLGGTGSYVLDLIAKTPVKEIHLFDGDKFSQHNAFRAPGAPSLDELRQEPKKVNYFRNVYARMRRNIIPHDGFLDGSNLGLLDGMDFAFLCLDSGEVKRPIVMALEERGTPFIDVGMGIELVDEALIGILRVTTSTTAMRDHVRAKSRIPFSGGRSNDYARNIQIAELNALNASLAVIKWKKLIGFYKDFENEHFSTFTIDGNTLINEDRA